MFFLIKHCLFSQLKQFVGESFIPEEFLVYVKIRSFKFCNGFYDCFFNEKISIVLVESFLAL